MAMCTHARSVILMTISRGNQLLSILVCFARTARTVLRLPENVKLVLSPMPPLDFWKKTIFASDRIGLRLLREEGLAPTTPTPPKMSWIMSNVVGDGRFPYDFKELNRETFNEVVIPFLIRHHESRRMFTDAVKTVLDKLKINIVGKCTCIQ